MKLLLIVVLSLLGLSAAIYPDGHFKYSKELTPGNFDTYINDAINADQTVMAPAWNKIVESYANNNDVKFGDVNLQKNRVQSGQPGSKGWPTIRYYNKQTGVAGADYEQKQQGAVCDELKVDANMESYVMEAAGTSKCDVSSKDGCSSKEADFIQKYTEEKTPTEVTSQLERLQRMGGSKLKPSGLKWKAQRIAILRKLAKQVAANEL